MDRCCISSQMIKITGGGMLVKRSNASGGVVKAGGWIQLRGGSKLDNVTFNSGSILTVTAADNDAIGITANKANIAFDITTVAESSTAMMLDADSTSKVTANYSIVAAANQALGTYELTDLSIASGTAFSIKVGSSTVNATVNGAAVNVGSVNYQLKSNAATGQLNLVLSNASRAFITTGAEAAQQLASVHSENENIDLDAIGDAVVFYKTFIRGYR